MLKLLVLSLALHQISSDLLSGADDSPQLSPSSQQQQQQLQSSSFQELSDASSSKCEPLNTDVLQLCKDIAYNETRYPNFMKQKSQQEAAAETALYLPLIRINCSPVLKLFLCTLYAPPCVKNYTLTLKPCREMCEKAKYGCEDYMKRFSFSWPEYIDCWRFPSFSGPEACVTDESYASGLFEERKASKLQPAQQQNWVIFLFEMKFFFLYKIQIQKDQWELIFDEKIRKNKK